MDNRIKANRARWAAELLSGEYTQGKRDIFPSENTYCCLGVAQMVFDKPKNKRKYGGYLISSRACERLGLDRKLLQSFSAANDAYGVTFDDIAEAIIESLGNEELLVSRLKVLAYR